MSDVFLSYASEDSERAQSLAKALVDRGWSVWWDRAIPPGQTFDQVIESELNAARCVIVLWSKHSVQSRWVKTEAASAAERDCLVPVLIDDVPIPFEFKRIQAARLVQWDGEAHHPEFNRLAAAIEHILDRTREPAPTVMSNTKPLGVARKRHRRRLPILLAAASGIALVAFVVARHPSVRVAPNNPTGSTDASTLNTSSAAPPEDAFSIQIDERISDGKRSTR